MGLGGGRLFLIVNGIPEEVLIGSKNIWHIYLHSV